MTWLVESEAGAAVGAALGFAWGIALGLAGAPASWSTAVYAFGIVLGGWRPARDGISALAQRRLDVDLLMVLAAVAAAGLGQWRDASLLIVIFAASGALENAASERAAAGVRTLLVDAPETAERLEGDHPVMVAIAALEIGDRVLVRNGARVPADGVVVDGEAAVDESSLTGEPLPVRKIPGRGVLAGTSVTEGVLIVEVRAEAADSVLARVASAVTDAVERRPPVQLAVERFERWYSIGVVAAAAVLIVVGPLLWGWRGNVTVTRTMTFLVVASPCAVVLATMPTTLSALAAAARHRVLIRGGGVLEQLAAVDVAAFDKTGTLTVGAPSVAGITRLAEHDESELLVVAASIEVWSEHPIGRAIVAEAARRGLTVEPVSDVVAVPSRGVQATVAERRVRVGGPAFLGDLDERAESASDAPRRVERRERSAPGSTERGTRVGIEIDGRLVGLIALEDAVRAEARCTVACLARAGVTETWMLTGDQRSTAMAVADTMAIHQVAHGLMPDDKARQVGNLRSNGRQVVYVGDGVNDAAALATASVGVSLAQRGTAMAIDAADVVLMDDNLHRLPDIVHLAQRARTLVRVNLCFALISIGVLVILDLVGHLPLVLGVVGHEGSSVLVALNGLRLLRWRPPTHEPGDTHRRVSPSDLLVGRSV